MKIIYYKDQFFLYMNVYKFSRNILFSNINIPYSYLFILRIFILDRICEKQSILEECLLY